MNAARIVTEDMSESPLRPWDSPRTDQRQVGLYGFGDDAAELRETLETLNWRVHRAAGRRPTFTEGCKAFVAAIVDDGVDRPLDLCRDLARLCPVVLVSDEAGFDFRIATAKAGVGALVRRPLNPIEIVDWITSFDDRQAAKPISVVVVDDDMLAGEINAAVLRSTGMTVATANTPHAALKLIEDLDPDLVLMDLQMPEVDGVELARAVRQNRRFASLPILFFSAERDEGRQLAARRLGGDDFLAKPIVPDKLVAVVRLRAERSRVLRSMIERDRLTGLDDHARFNERLSHELERCRRTGAELSLVSIDVDHFKQVNDSFGHPTGDAVLRKLAALLRRGLRGIDVVGRCGGEEFGVILLDTDVAAAESVVEKLKDRFGALSFEAAGRQFSTTFSAGIASSRDSAYSMVHLVMAADAALYRAKSDGRNLIRIASAGS